MLRGPVTGTTYRFTKGQARYVDAADSAAFLGRATKGVPHFVQLRGPNGAVAPEVRQPKLEVAVREVRQPDFPIMPVGAPPPPVEPVTSMTLEDVREQLINVTEDTLASWLIEEQAGKGRKSIVKAITAELNSRSRAQEVVA
jgi:hypothetical protein